MKRFVLFVLIIIVCFTACRSRGPRNAVWESKHHPSDDLRKEYKKANEKGTKDYKNSKKRYKRLHRN
ncbi:MAG: hypothetical protein IPP32_02305 [Bacteroidetes bacterium]|nr:hypothetical protein [Bacteroidota bacterium]